MTTSKNKNKKSSDKTAISIFAGAIFIAVALYLGLTRAKLSFVPRQTTNQSSPTVVSSPPPQLTSTLNPTGSSQPSSIPSPTLKPEITWKKSDLIVALSQRTTIPENEIKFSVGNETEKDNKILLRGTVSREGEMGGAGFFAVVDQNGVQVTYAGQGVPQCSEVNPYGYPVSWADYCLDQNNNVVPR